MLSPESLAALSSPAAPPPAPAQASPALAPLNLAADVDAPASAAPASPPLAAPAEPTKRPRKASPPAPPASGPGAAVDATSAAELPAAPPPSVVAVERSALELALQRCQDREREREEAERDLENERKTHARAGSPRGGWRRVAQAEEALEAATKAAKEAREEATREGQKEEERKRLAGLASLHGLARKLEALGSGVECEDVDEALAIYDRLVALDAKLKGRCAAIGKAREGFLEAAVRRGVDRKQLEGEFPKLAPLFDTGFVAARPVTVFALRNAVRAQLGQRLGGADELLNIEVHLLAQPIAAT